MKTLIIVVAIWILVDMVICWVNYRFHEWVKTKERNTIWNEYK